MSVVLRSRAYLVRRADCDRAYTKIPPSERGRWPKWQCGPPRPRWVGEILHWEDDEVTGKSAGRLRTTNHPLPAVHVLRPLLGTHKYALATRLRVLRPRNPRHRIPSLPYTPYLLAPGLTHQDINPTEKSIPTKPGRASVQDARYLLPFLPPPIPSHERCSE